MYQIGRLVIKSYIPDELESGMLFYIGGEFVLLDKVPFDEEEYIKTNGYPVEIYIIDEGNPNLNDGYIIAYPDEIGWFDEGDHSDEYEEININHLNLILENDGYVEMPLEEYSIDDEECQDDCEEYRPIFIDGKIVFRILSDDDSPEEEKELEDEEEFPDFHSNI